MKIVIVGFGTAGKYYLNILKNYKIIKKIYILNDKKIKKTNLYEQINFKNIKNKIDEIDYAIIATPPYDHFRYAKFFLQNNLNVLIEKPFVLKIKHAKILINLANKVKKKCWVAFQNRHNLATSKLKYYIKNKLLGKISSVDSVLLWNRSRQYYKTSWRGKYRTDGGVLANQAIHLLDMLVYLFGPIKKFNVLAGFEKKKLEAEDLIYLSFIHKNNIFTSLKATTRANRDYRSAMDVIGTKGRALIKGISLNTFHYFKKEKLITDKKNSENFPLGLGPISGMGTGHKKILKEFLNAKIRKSSKKLEIQKNIYLLKLIHSIYNSIKPKNKFLFSVKNKESIWGK